MEDINNADPRPQSRPPPPRETIMNHRISMPVFEIVAFLAIIGMFSIAG